jgi:head-tail adaptor
MTEIGMLRERIRFQQRGLDANGDRLGAWDDGASVSRAARFKYRTGRRDDEAIFQARMQGDQPVDVTVRFDRQTAQVTNAWRVVRPSDGRVFNIRSIIYDELRAYITLLCVEDGSGGGV